MARDLPLRCTCGKLRGVAKGISPELGNHVVCYCGDCQAFARFLDRPGIMDDGGGTAIFQMPRSHVAITEGLGELRCVRLSNKGLHRWYAGCCRTPIGNTLGAGVPFIGLIDACMDIEGGERARDEWLGTPIGIQAKLAPNAPPGAHAGAPIAYLARVARKLARWWLTGKGFPTPFFDSKGTPSVEPQVLSAPEREALRVA